jgi:cold shock CspA family protein
MSSINYTDKYNEYHNKFWSLHHANKDLLKEINDLKMKLDIYERRVISGKIKTISQHHDYGLVTHSEYGDIFFHKSKCNFQLSNSLVDKKVKFNLTITKKFEATNVELQMEDMSALDVLEFMNHSVDESHDSS